MTEIDPRNLFGFLIHDITRLMGRAFGKHVGERKVTRAQARVLGYVFQFEGSNQSEIAALMDIQKITLTKLVDDLEEMKLIERRSDLDDRRVRRLYLAEGAQPVLDKIWGRLSELSVFALDALPADRRHAFVQDMITVRKHLMANDSMPLQTLEPASVDASRDASLSKVAEMKS